MSRKSIFFINIFQRKKYFNTKFLLKVFKKNMSIYRQININKQSQNSQRHFYNTIEGKYFLVKKLKKKFRKSIFSGQYFSKKNINAIFWSKFEKKVNFLIDEHAVLINSPKLTMIVLQTTRNQKFLANKRISRKCIANNKFIEKSIFSGQYFSEEKNTLKMFIYRQMNIQH